VDGQPPAIRDNGRVMKVLLRNPRRELEVPGPMSVVKLLARLDLHRDAVLVIRGDTLVPGDALLDDADEIEIRPVISGGAA
jgi:sulfur carrier protein